MSNIQFVKDYRDNEELRGSFNELAKNTFGLDFEDWYQNGYWKDNYNPHSIVVDGKVVANVSVNLTDFIWKGERKRLIQLGTVMTEEAYRKKGYIRMIMEEIQKEYAGKVDGIYLFANNEVLDFYPKFGFKRAQQYEYVKTQEIQTKATVEQILMKDKAAWDMLEQKIKANEHSCAFDMIENSALNMFYITKFMQENVFYEASMDAYIVAEVEEDELIIDMVIAKEDVDLNRAAEAFGRDIKKVKLGFTPKDTTGFTMQEVDQDDSMLFVKGEGLADFTEEKLTFPLLAHA